MNINDYRKYKSILINTYISDGLRRCVLICVTSHIPLLALYTFLSEEYPEFSANIASINEFYGNRG